MSKNDSDHLVEMLVATSVKRIYAITGDSLNPVNGLDNFQETRPESLFRDCSKIGLHSQYAKTSS